MLLAKLPIGSVHTQYLFLTAFRIHINIFGKIRHEIDTSDKNLCDLLYHDPAFALSEGITLLNKARLTVLH